MRTLILASESPRRKELLAKAGLRFRVAPVKISEIPDKTLNASEQILDISARKARAALDVQRRTFDKPFVILAADTEVILDGSPLGKPSSVADAEQTLRRLSGRAHEVMTGVWMIDSVDGKVLSHLETTRVIFRTLSDDEISTYVASGEPMDKAGSYGIQGLGGKLVERIEGDFQNVVGLPVAAVAKLIARGGWTFTSEVGDE